MSKIQEAKDRQGYIPKQGDRPACKNCKYRTFVKDWYKDYMTKKDMYSEKNQRCSLGGFAVKLMAVCDDHTFGEATERGDDNG